VGVLYLVLTREKGHMTEVTVNVPVTLEIDNEFEVDDDGVAYVITLAFHNEDNEPILEARISWEEIIEAFLEENGDVEGYQQIYLLAHELDRYVEMLRNRAALIEDSFGVVEDMFNIR